MKRARASSPYPQFRGKDAHVRIYEWHHGRKVAPGYIVHHRDENKQNNAVCSNPPPCPLDYCGNLESLTRADHILQHRPGRMGGRKIPNKAGSKHYYCSACGREKSRWGDLCRPCFEAQRPTSKDGQARPRKRVTKP